MDRKLTVICGYLLPALLSGIVFAQIVAPVKIEPARERPIAESVQGYGTIEPLPEDNIPVSANSPMRILEILVKPGDKVKKGQLVVRLERDHSIDVAVSKARITMQKDSIDYQRAVTLYDSGVIPGVKLENARTDYEVARADYKLQKQQLNYAIQNSELRSPIDGIVTAVNGAVGQIADPSQPILRIVNLRHMIAIIGIEIEDLRHMIAIIGIEIEDISSIKVGQDVNITIPNLPESPLFKGTVSKLNREINSATQLINVWVTLNNPDEFLQPGMFAEARIIVKQDSTALTVPRSAVLTDQQGPYVFVIRDSTAYKIQVRTGIGNDSLVQILNGLRKGQPVVYQGNYELQDSMKVRVK
ncbi:MAG: efflux RND transporter periplasmic adaptor subunit [Calditrichia bacterium]